jgi:ERCC4-type nuclease
MLIKIDCRETDLYAKMTQLQELHQVKEELKKGKEPSSSSIKLQSASLPLGDIIICADAGTDANAGAEKVLIERKTLADLAASIRDGRYQEQSFRLNECNLPNHHIIYLIEGDLKNYKSFHSHIDKKTLLAAMVSINYFKGFSLYRTQNLDETSEWLWQFAVKLQRENAPGFYQRGHPPAQQAVSPPAQQADLVGPAPRACNAVPPAQQASSPADPSSTSSYCSILKRTKKNNITPANIGEIMLSQIPGVSSASAEAIMVKFGTFASLFAALQADPRALQDIKINNRKINKSCISNIYTYLLRNLT